MASTKPSSRGSGGGSRKGSSRPSSKGSSKRTNKPSDGTSSSKFKSKPKPATSRPTVQHKPRPTSNAPLRKKRRVYTEKELGVPTLNMITPAGVQKPKGKKKGKVFVDDSESMMTILAMVNADKEGQIESKIMKARQLEEIRQARQKEMEARQEEKKAKFEETKDSLRRHRTRKTPGDEETQSTEPSTAIKAVKSVKKRVSFG